MSWGYEEELQKWTDYDLYEFAEWTNLWDWVFVEVLDNWRKLNEDGTYIYKTSQGLKIDWEVETGRREK